MRPRRSGPFSFLRAALTFPVIDDRTIASRASTWPTLRLPSLFIVDGKGR